MNRPLRGKENRYTASAFRPVSKQSLSDGLAQRIRELIRMGGYEAGDRLPAIMEMARQFQVGHPTVREALKKLEAMGVVQIRHGSGVYVSRGHEALVVAATGYVGTVTKKMLLDLVRARIPIEVQSAALAARNAEEAHLEGMRQLLARAGRSLDDDALLNSTNMAFHQKIAQASGNAVVAQLVDVLRDLFVEQQRSILDVFGSRQVDHREHAGILEALERRDEVLASERMREHLEGVERAVLRWDPERHPVG
ncbi:MAG TPA: FadR/GntR family transcriptional regulator [Longimicrobiales bacterium]